MVGGEVVVVIEPTPHGFEGEFLQVSAQLLHGIHALPYSAEQLVRSQLLPILPVPPCPALCELYRGCLVCDKRELYTFKVIGTVPSTDLLIFKYDNIRRALMARCSKSKQSCISA